MYFRTFALHFYGSVMNIEEFREYCLSLNGVTESMPFGPDTLVFKVMEKMFALTNLSGDFSINLKCEPERALQLREEFPAVLPGYHMNKQHWNTVIIDGSIEDETLRSWIAISYDLIVASLPQNKKTLLQSGRF